MMVDVRCGWWKAGWTNRRASWPQVSGLHAGLNETVPLGDWNQG